MNQLPKELKSSKSEEKELMRQDGDTQQLLVMLCRGDVSFNFFQMCHVMATITAFTWDWKSSFSTTYFFTGQDAECNTSACNDKYSQDLGLVPL